MDVTVILVNWNQTDCTIRCLESIVQQTVRQTDLDYRIVVVDNGSDPDACDRLATYLGRQAYGQSIQLIKNRDNLGFAGGNNVGIRFAQEHYSPDYIWLLNNDIIVQPGALNQLGAAAAKYPEVRIWGSTIYELDPTLHFHCAGGFRYHAWLSVPSPISFPKAGDIPKGLYYPLPEMDYPSGAAMFIRADTFREFGLLDEMYFLYYEELDLVKQIGGKKYIAWCPDSVLHHQSGSSTGSKNPNAGQGSWIAHYYGNLSALKYTWKHHRLYLPSVFLFRFCMKSILFIYFRDFRSFAPLGKAYFDFLKWLFRRKSAGIT